MSASDCSSDTPSTAPDPQQEAGRARARRLALGITRPSASMAAAEPAAPSASGGQWALALSGGGIRSATFCLGVLQGMAKIPDPGLSRGPGMAGHAGSSPAGDGKANAHASPLSDDRPKTGSAAPSARTPWPLLAQFDFLSTVSGGGYIGGFFSSLFVRGRLSGQSHETALETTERAYEALKEEPPGRIHRETSYDARHPGRTALAWLRDNGRYMAPSATGDLIYGLTIAVRNWFATQYVVGTMMVMLLAALQAGRWGLATCWPAYREWESQMLDQAVLEATLVWWSPSWGLCGLILLLAALPIGIAYWFSHPAGGKDLPRQAPQGTAAQADAAATGTGGSTLHDHLAARPLYWSVASLMGLLLGVVLSALAWHVMQVHGRVVLSRVLGGMGLSVLLSLVWYLAATYQTRKSPQGSITLQRVMLTRWLTSTMIWLFAVAGLAAIETIAQTAWLWLSTQHGAVVSGLLAALVWLMHQGAMRMGEQRDKTSLLNRLPMGLLAGIVGGTLWVTVAAGLDILLLQVAWPQGWANPKVLWDPALTRQALTYASGACLVATGMALVVGRFPGFLNLSTLQNLYSARIIRAYLGATNHARFTPEAGGAARDVAEPIQGDSLSADDIHRNPLAPIHFVNVCVNQSVSPGEQLIQRDRKGKPLVVAPGGIYFDTQAYGIGTGSDESELCFPLSFGEWLGVSGAAFSTGLGRGTGLGMSLALGFANVRLGRWWKGLPTKPGTREHWVKKLFTTQAYLLDELRGLFYGDHRPYQYLSDGGHFENMAVYELLRPERNRDIRLIVVCDCGCDPDYQFEDLANLTRLVRIDHGLEIRVNRRAPREALLNEVFARPEDFQRDAEGKLPERNGKCAILLDVVGTERSIVRSVQPGALLTRILLIKPTLLLHPGVDIDQYHATHGCFPQETTMDQFFDEAQWESYRQLGLRLAQRVFTADGMPGYPERLWPTLLDGLPA
ncbi:MAG: hypothetical protein QM742_08695 [Aquabacterium sp.]